MKLVVNNPNGFETVSLSPEATTVLKTILEFHAQNDTPEDGYYDWESFEELCGVLGVRLYPTENEPNLFEAPPEVAS